MAYDVEYERTRRRIPACSRLLRTKADRPESASSQQVAVEKEREFVPMQVDVGGLALGFRSVAKRAPRAAFVKMGRTGAAHRRVSAGTQSVGPDAEMLP